MATRLGLACVAYYFDTTWKELTVARDVSLGLEAGEADVTTRGANGWELTIATLKKGSVDIELLYDTADPGFTALQNAYFTSSPLKMAFMDGPALAPASTAQGLLAYFSVSKFSRDEPLQEALKIKATVKPTYSPLLAPTWHTGELN